MLTLVNIDGSAPYPIGSQMLINQNSEYRGQITGGCAEVALIDQAVAAIARKENITRRYGLNSPYFDIQLPCGSGIDVHFAVTDCAEDYLSIRSALQSRQPVEHKIKTELGTFTKGFIPTVRLIAYGQGPILESLAKISQLSGFEIICIAQDLATINRLAQIDIVASELSTVNGRFRQHHDPFTAVVSLFHEHDLETEILDQALQTNCFYIGALGSKLTHSRRIKALIDRGVAAAELGAIHGPVGINIGAQTPAQIAISIIAQVIQQAPRITSFYHAG